MNKRSWLKSKFGLVIISLLLSLLLVEFALMFFDRIKTYKDIINLKGWPFIIAHSPYLPFTLPKNVSFSHRHEEFDVVYKTNKYGYRGYLPRSIVKPSNIKRILFVGDSFTLGFGSKLKNSFVQQVQDCLNSEKYSVINAAYHAGYSPDSYYAYLVREGFELSPDIVIVVLYTGNDVTDIIDNKWLETDESGAPTKLLTYRLYADTNGDVIHPPETLEALLPWNYKVSVLRNSYVFIAVTQLFNQIFNISTFSDPFVREELTEEDGWQRFIIAVKSIGDLCTENGVDLVFATIPPPPNRGNDNRKRDNRIAHIIENKFNFRLIDLRPLLSEAAYFKVDGHFNRKGNRIASKAIIEYLLGESLITIKKECEQF